MPDAPSDRSSAAADQPAPTGSPRSGDFRTAWARRAIWQRAAAVASLGLTLGAGTMMLVGPDSEVAVSTTTGASQDLPASSDQLDGLPGGTHLLAPGFWEGPIPLPPADTERQPDAEDPDSPAAAATAAGDADGPIWSPALFKMGFSFFMGFSIAFAVRSFVRISLVAVGMMALMLFGLEAMGLVTVQWGEMAARWDGLLAWLKPQITSFHGLITGQLPSAAAVTAGLATGWRRG